MIIPSQAVPQSDLGNTGNTWLTKTLRGDSGSRPNGGSWGRPTRLGEVTGRCTLPPDGINGSSILAKTCRDNVGILEEGELMAN
jgi:hypothetical protein